MEFQFRQRYRLPPTDPRFLDATRDDILIDHYSHFYANPANANSEEFEDEDFEAELARELKRIEDGEFIEL